MSSTRARSLAAWPSHFAVVIVDGDDGEEEEEEEEEEASDPALRFRPPPVVRLRLPPPRELIRSVLVCGGLCLAPAPRPLSKSGRLLVWVIPFCKVWEVGGAGQ